MYKNLLVLPDGTEISSGSGTKNAIKNIKSTQVVNSGEELTIGSACSNMIEATLFTPGGGLNITAGDELTHYRVAANGSRTKAGLFTVEKPGRPTANTMKLVGYDRIAKLDKDLTAWLESLDEWPYSVNSFAFMVCRACGLNYVEQINLPNAGFLIRQWKKSGVTGRQIMRWLGEIVCRFVYADPDGNIQFGWYKDSGKIYTPAGENYYFAGSLTCENYQVAPVRAVQIRTADNESGSVWPQIPDGTNAYIITGNPILATYAAEELLGYLDVISEELARVTYTPCEFSVRANMDVNAGDIVHITDKNGKTLTAYVMAKITSGQRDTISCTGSQRMDSASAINNKSESTRKAETEIQAQEQVNALDKKLDQTEVVRRLTNDGQSKAFYQEGNEVFLNAYYLKGKSVIEGETYLRPTYEDCLAMLRSLSFPDQYPAEPFFDLNNDGVFDVNDVRLAQDVFYGAVDISECVSLEKSVVTVVIEPGNPFETVKIVGVNMWGSEVVVSLGANMTNIPVISGDCSIGGQLSVRDHATIQALSLVVGGTPKMLAWKDNGDGTSTLIGK